MLTLAEIDEIIDQLYTRQADRLVKTHASLEDFLMRPEEKAVTFEIDCYENLRRDYETDTATT